MSSAQRGTTENAAPGEILKSFRYLPPAVEEQRAFALQFIGSLIALGVVAAILLLKVRLPFDGSVLWGVGAGLAYTLARSAWRLEIKARRSACALIAVAGDSLHLTDRHGETERIDWDDFGLIDVKGGRLILEWPGGQFAVGAREIEDGMTLVNEVMQRSGRGKAGAPSNFIPLEPR